MDKLIAKYLDKNLTLEEQHKLLKWLEESSEHQEQFRKIESYWLHYGKDYAPQREEVWHRVHQEMQKPETPVKRFWRPSVLQLAASLILAIGVIALFLKDETAHQNRAAVNTPWIEKITRPGQVLTTRLPDGSIVKLNGNSLLRFPEKFHNETREVELIGEAFFDIEREEARPFHVSTANFSVVVLGTSFDVKAYQGETDQHVAVKSGRVRVASASKKKKYLIPNEMVRIDGQGKLKKETLDDEAIFGWVNRELILKEQPLSEVLNATEKWFGVDINLTSHVSSHRLYTSRFTNPSLTQVLESICKVYKLRYSIKDKTKITIRANEED